MSNVPSSPLRVYDIQLRSDADSGAYSGDIFENDVTVQGQSYANTLIYSAIGGGDGDGTSLTRIVVTKQLTGDGAAAVPADTTFTVQYGVGGDVRTMPVGIGEEGRNQSDRFPKGSTFVISEIDLPVVPGVTWGDYSFTGPGLTSNGDGTWSLATSATDPAGTVELVLSNHADVVEPEVGNLTVTKTVTGPGADLLTGDETYTVNYSYTLDGEDETTGTLTLTDGHTTGLPTDLPTGTDVTLSEATATPVTIDDTTTVEYDTPIFTIGETRGDTVTVTIGNTEPIAVTLENPTRVVTEEPTTDPTPTTHPTPTTDPCTPTTPTDPTVPTTPTDPTDPTDPTTPTDPTDPCGTTTPPTPTTEPCTSTSPSPTTTNPSPTTEPAPTTDPCVAPTSTTLLPTTSTYTPKPLASTGTSAGAVPPLVALLLAAGGLMVLLARRQAGARH